MKKKLITIYLKYQAYIWSLLSPLGIWGPGIISAIDSAAFGIPMDIVMIGYAARERENLLLVAAEIGIQVDFCCCCYVLQEHL